MAPCVLWIDEIDKGFGGEARSDGGTSQRVLANLLTWMAEKKSPVFVVATANRIDRMQGELLRKGRFDEIFFLDIPGKEARKEILRIQIRLKQPTGNEIVGTIATSSLDDTILLYTVDDDTIPDNTLTAVKKIINPLTFAPENPGDGDRYLIIDTLGDSTATVQSSTWGSLVASVGDIIQYNLSLIHI